jgi:hypothetical protein
LVFGASDKSKDVIPASNTIYFFKHTQIIRLTTFKTLAVRPTVRPTHGLAALGAFLAVLAPVMPFITRFPA